MNLGGLSGPTGGSEVLTPENERVNNVTPQTLTFTPNIERSFDYICSTVVPPLTNKEKKKRTSFRIQGNHGFR